MNVFRETEVPGTTFFFSDLKKRVEANAQWKEG